MLIHAYAEDLAYRDRLNRQSRHAENQFGLTRRSRIGNSVVCVLRSAMIMRPRDGRSPRMRGISLFACYFPFFFLFLFFPPPFPLPFLLFFMPQQQHSVEPTVRQGLRGQPSAFSSPLGRSRVQKRIADPAQTS